MKFLKPNQAKWEEALISAFRKKAKPTPGENWESRVMRSIRDLGPLSESDALFALFGQWVWHLVPVASGLLLVLFVWVAQLEFFPEFELASHYWSEPTELTLFDAFEL